MILVDTCTGYVDRVTCHDPHTETHTSSHVLQLKKTIVYIGPAKNNAFKSICERHGGLDEGFGCNPKESGHATEYLVLDFHILTTTAWTWNGMEVPSKGLLYTVHSSP